MTGEMALTHLVIFSLFLAAICGEKVDTRSCDDEPDAQCTVTEVRIDPCKTYKGGVCALAKGSDVTITFDFTPKFAASNLTSLVSWNTKPFTDMANINTCTLTTCPTVPDTPQVYSFTLHVGKKLPPGTYPIKWKLWNSENPTQDVCCFLTTIKLPRN